MGPIFPARRPDGSFCVEVRFRLEGSDHDSLAAAVALWLDEWLRASRYWADAPAAHARGVLDYQDEFVGPPVLARSDRGALSMRLECRPGATWCKDWLVLRILSPLRDHFGTALQVDSIGSCGERDHEPVEPGETRVSAARAAELAIALRSSGWLVLELPDGIRDKDGFLDGLRGVVPLDPPMPGPRNHWDALRDSLCGGLLLLPDPWIALVWQDATTMCEASPQEFDVAASTLAEAARDLGEATVTGGSVKRVAVILGGDWP